MPRKTLYNYTQGKLPERPFLDDKCYAQSIRTNVNPCTDCLIFDSSKKTIFLPTRITKTAPGPWFIGGVWKSQVSALKNMATCFNRETGLAVAQNRFVRIPFLDANGLPPQTLWSTGRNDMHFFYSIILNSKEKKIVAENLNESEYDITKGLREFTREQLTTKNVRDIIIDCYDALMS